MAAKYEPAARAFLSSWQSRCHVGRLGSTDLLSGRFWKTAALPEGLLLLLRPAITALILGVVGLLVFLAGIGRPARMFYDEGYFVPEARTFRLSTPLPP